MVAFIQTPASAATARRRAPLVAICEKAVSGLHNPANAHVVGLDLPAQVFHDLRCFPQLRDFFLR